MRDSAPLTDQPTRRRLVDIIRSMPGLSLSALRREAGTGWGTANYHLHLLESAGLVRSVATNRDRLLFPSDYSPERLRIDAALRQGRAQEFASVIAANPGISQKQLCEACLTSRKIVRHYLRLLEGAGLVRMQREDGSQRHYATSVLVAHLGTTLPAAAPFAPPRGP